MYVFVFSFTRGETSYCFYEDLGGVLRVLRLKWEFCAGFRFFCRHLEGCIFNQKLFLAGGDKIEVWQDQRNIIRKSPTGLFFLLSKD